GVVVCVEFCFVYVSVFFFQAEDGIRDDLVTGVQTCALPISRNSNMKRSSCASGGHLSPARGAARPLHVRVASGLSHEGRGRDDRSEERRVGKECRGGRTGND